MKKSILLFISLLLCACTAIDEDSVENRIASILSKNATDVDIAPTNKDKPFYQYYLPNDISVEEANDTGSILTKDGFTIVFNFNTSNLIISEYYTDYSLEEDDEDIVYKYYTEESFKELIEEDLLVANDAVNSKESKQSSENKEVDYQINKDEKNGVIIYSGYYDSNQDKGLYFQLNMKRVQDDYFLHLNGTIASFTSVVPAEEVDKIVNSMLVILKSIEYDKEKVLETYSLNYDIKNMEEAFKESNDFIYQNLPAEGYLEDIINNGQ